MIRYYNLKEVALILGWSEAKVYRSDHILLPDFQQKGNKARVRLYSAEVLEKIKPKEEWGLIQAVCPRKPRKKELVPRKPYKRKESEGFDPGLNALWSSYKGGCKNRALKFLLNRNEFYNLVHQSCHYCGKVPQPRQLGSYTINVNGIDRVDSDKDYEMTNCVPCCILCNKMKGALTKDEFLNHINQISQFQRSRPNLTRNPDLV